MTQAEQTLRVLNLVRHTHDCPTSKWQILLMLTIYGPMRHSDLCVSMVITGCYPTLCRLSREGLITKERVNKRIVYIITSAGMQKAAEIIQGKPIKSHQ